MTYGVAKAKLVPCYRSEHHGFHPADEKCEYCEPVAEAPHVPETDEPEYIGGFSYGMAAAIAKCAPAHNLVCIVCGDPSPLTIRCHSCLKFNLWPPVSP